MKVLIADDSGILRKNLTKLIASVPGVTSIVESHSLFNTLQQIRIEKPGVLVLDLQLGDGSGFQVLEFLRGVEDPPRVFVFTNYPSDHNRVRCQSLGAQMLLDKSFDQKILVQNLTELAGEMRSKIIKE